MSANPQIVHSFGEIFALIITKCTMQRLVFVYAHMVTTIIASDYVSMYACACGYVFVSNPTDNMIWMHTLNWIVEVLYRRLYKNSMQKWQQLQHQQPNALLSFLSSWEFVFYHLLEIAWVYHSYECVCVWHAYSSDTLLQVIYIKLNGKLHDTWIRSPNLTFYRHQMMCECLHNMTFAK